MKTSRKVDRGHSKKECSRPLWNERRGRAGRAMNEKELFCFCGLCVCGNKGMFKVNRKIISAFKQYFIMPSAPLICYSRSPFSIFLTLYNLAKCIRLQTCVEIFSYPGIFFYKIFSHGTMGFCLFWENLISFLRQFLFLLVVLLAPDVLIYLLVPETHYICPQHALLSHVILCK
jgi:hypothetical protein